MLKFVQRVIARQIVRPAQSPAPAIETPKPRALVSAIRLVDFAGSEITCLEVAQVLTANGYSVFITATEIGSPWIDEVPDGIIVINVNDIEENAHFDLLWLHHSLIAYKLIAEKKVTANLAVFSSLSHFEPMESPPVSGIELSRYLVNSGENFRYFKKMYPELAQYASIFPNYCPKEFFAEFSVSEPSGHLASILIVSNHPPPEVVDLISLLQSSGIYVKLVGINGTIERVTPNLCSEFDAVITIGKTVQYCLGMGKPVFCYDHFGGPGWIVPEVFASALDYNFSGRCEPRSRGAADLHRELLNGFSQALKFRNDLRERALLAFSLEVNIEKVLNLARGRPFKSRLSTSDANSLGRLAAIYEQQRQLVRHWQGVAVQHWPS